MPFGLIKAGAKFQQMMDTIFGSQTGKNMQLYVDDMITTSTRVNSHAINLRETFSNVRLHDMRLNPAKCSFDLTVGKLLGFWKPNEGSRPTPYKLRLS